MKDFEMIVGCKVHTYEIKNDNIYDSDINEQLLERRRRAREIDIKCMKYSPTLFSSYQRMRV